MLFHRRVIDACATTNKDVSVYFNGEKISIKDFEKYCTLAVRALDSLLDCYDYPVQIVC